VDVVLRIERPRLRTQVALFTSLIGGWIGLYPSGRDTTVSSGSATKTLPLFIIAQRDARLRGAELSVEGTVSRRVVATLMTDMVRGTTRGGEALPFMPPVRVAAALRWDDGRWQLGGAWRYVLAQPRVSSGEFATGAAALLEGHAGLRLLSGAQVHTIMLRGENLGDRLYRDATSRSKDFAPSAGRNISLLYRITF
jgi:iron complex outermembrane recepter protein